VVQQRPLVELLIEGSATVRLRIVGLFPQSTALTVQSVHDPRPPAPIIDPGRAGRTTFHRLASW
jgi:hypothetical protein